MAKIFLKLHAPNFRPRLLLGVFFCALLAGCGTGGEQPQPTMFRYNQHATITSLDPAFASSQANIWAVMQLYNGLVQLDDSLRTKPSIAKRWDISEDGKTYTFYLRDDVYFHDCRFFPSGKGRKCTAKDVVYSFKRLTDPDLHAKGAWVFDKKLDSLSAFEAPNDTTFILRLQKPYMPMLGILTTPFCCVVPQEAVEGFGKEFRSNPVGTGPFHLVLWKENQTLILHKNPQYFEKGPHGEQLPYLDGVRTYFMKERQTAFFQFQKGKLHYFFGLESAYVNELLSREGDLLEHQKERMAFYKNPYLNTEYLGILMDPALPNMKNHPLGNKKVRQALNWGIDRASMLRTLRNGVGVPANSGFCSLGLPSFDATAAPGYGYDPERARRLLAEAGYPSGQGMAPFTLSANPEYADLCTFLVKQWSDLGVPVKLEILDGATLRSKRDKGDLPFFRASWIADYPDAENYFSLFYGKNASPPNYFRFKNDTFDQLYERAVAEPNEALRFELYHQMDRILIEEAPVVFLFYDQSAVFTQPSVTGVKVNGLNMLDVKRIMVGDEGM